MSGALIAAVERAWRPRTGADRLLRALLVPASWLYGGAVWLRNAAYDARLLPTTRVAARVVSVGNLTVGGTGKTPAALWLADRLAARGRRVAIVARGYGKRRSGVVVVGAGGRAWVSAEEGGDEAVMMARRFAGPVVTGERRAAAAQVACDRFGVDTIVLDDGLQHRALARDVDLVLLTADEAARRLLPAGSRREPARALARARAALVVGADAPSWPPLPAGLPCFRARLRPTALVRADPDGAWHEEPLAGLRDQPVVAVAGIAHPHRLAAALAAAGAQVRRELRFPDHHAYDAGDVAALLAARPDGLLITTEKDLVKLAARAELGAPLALRALRVALEVDEAERLVDLLEAG